MTLFGDRTFKEVNKLKKFVRVALTPMIGILIKREKNTSDAHKAEAM